MSSKPTPTGAKRAVEILTRCAQLTDTIGTLGPEVRSKTVQLKALEEERHGLQRELGQLMRSMDCDAPGNMGWEGRVTWLVAEMFKHMKEGEEDRSIHPSETTVDWIKTGKK